MVRPRTARPRNKSTRKSVTPDDILAGHSLEVRGLAENLRRVIKETVPDAEEVAYPVWHGIGYRHSEAGYFCGIFPQHESVKLGFEFGVLLPDPEGVLGGDGRQVRYVTIEQGRGIPSEAIRKLVLAALSLPTSREAKLWLVRAMGGQRG